MKRANLIKIVISVSVCLLVGFLSSLATTSSIQNWYPTIEKPFFTPPDWIFMPVWTILYIMMGYSFAIIWSRKSDSKRTKKVLRGAMLLFGVQLVFNLLWSLIFFGLCNPFLGLIEILLLWLLLFETYKSFKKINYFAAKLLIPYLIWVSFATILNGTIWFMNS